MLSLKNVVVHYGGVQALKGISLEVREGVITCLIGANGAGKSTTLRAISGLVALTSGEIWFQGRRIDGMEPEEIVEMGIGHVPEGKRLFLEMNVRDNLLTGAHLRGEKDVVAQDLERIFGYFPVLGTAAAKPASKMSGGEQQMIAIGRGLMAAPKLLLLDEPSLGLSPILTREVGSIIKRIADEGVSILLIEQNANLALQLAQTCYVLETGSIALEGASKDLQNNEHVKAAYLGISCVVGTPMAVIPSAPAKDKGAPEEKPVKTTAERWQETKAPVQESQRRLPEKQSIPKQASARSEKEPSRLDNLQADIRLPITASPVSSVVGIHATDRLKLEDLGSALATKAPSARLIKNSSPERLSKVVKKIFAPKQG